MNQIPNIEEVEKEITRCVVEAWREHRSVTGAVKEIMETLHQQLQKAVQEEKLKHCCCVIETSKVIERCKLHGDELQKAREESATPEQILAWLNHNGHQDVALTLLTKLRTDHSELDQDNNN